MKNFFFAAILLAFTTTLSAQSITAVSPNSGTQGTNGLAVQISGSGAIFNQASSTDIYFSQGSSTYIYGYNTIINSSNSLTTYIDINGSDYTGLYDLFVSSNGNPYTLNSAFTVLAAPVPQIITVDTNYAATGTTLNVTITGLNTSFQSGSSTSVWFSQGSSTINYPTSFSVIDPATILATLTLDGTYPIGFYDVNVYDPTDNWIQKPNAFVVTDTTVGLVSVIDSGTYNHPGDSIVIIIYGTGTHFGVAGTTTTVWLGQAHRSQVANIFPTSMQIISATQIRAVFAIPAGSPDGYYDVFVLNTLDGELTKQRAYNLPTGITSAVADKIRVYPNPVTDKMYIEFTNQEAIAAITLTSVNGTVVIKNTTQGNWHEELNTENLSAGVYILSITDRSGAVSYKKIVIEK